MEASSLNPWETVQSSKSTNCDANLNNTYHLAEHLLPSVMCPVPSCFLPSFLPVSLLRYCENPTHQGSPLWTKSFVQPPSFLLTKYSLGLRRAFVCDTCCRNVPATSLPTCLFSYLPQNLTHILSIL